MRSAPLGAQGARATRRPSRPARLHGRDAERLPRHHGQVGYPAAGVERFLLDADPSASSRRARLDERLRLLCRQLIDGRERPAGYEAAIERECGAWPAAPTALAELEARAHRGAGDAQRRFEAEVGELLSRLEQATALLRNWQVLLRLADGGPVGPGGDMAAVLAADGTAPNTGTGEHEAEGVGIAAPSSGTR